MFAKRKMRKMTERLNETLAKVEPVPPATMPVFPDGYVFRTRKSTSEEKDRDLNPPGSWDYLAFEYPCAQPYRYELIGPDGEVEDKTAMRVLTEVDIIRVANDFHSSLLKRMYKAEMEAKYLGDYPPKTIPLASATPTLTKEA